MLPGSSAAFPAVSDSVADARQFVAGNLLKHGYPATTRYAAPLLVSELATNAVVHAATPFSVVLFHEAGGVAIEVADSGPGQPVIPDTADERGRGLRIVASLAREWGVRPRPSGGKAVFFRLGS